MDNPVPDFYTHKKRKATIPSGNDRLNRFDAAIEISGDGENCYKCVREQLVSSTIFSIEFIFFRTKVQVGDK